MHPDSPPEPAAIVRKIIETVGDLPPEKHAELRNLQDQELGKLDREEQAARKSALLQRVIFIRDENDNVA